MSGMIIERKGNQHLPAMQFIHNIFIIKVFGTKFGALLKEIVQLQILPSEWEKKKSSHQCRRCRRHGLNPWVRKIP